MHNGRVLHTATRTPTTSLANTVPFSMKSCSQDFELVMLASDAGDIFLRYGGRFSGWWQFKPGQRYAEQIDDDKVIDAMDSVRLMRYWTAALFLKSGFDMNDMSARYLSFIGGQSSKRCSVHAVPLCQEPRSSGKLCSTPWCSRKAAWSCPIDDCTAAICRHHFKDG